VKKFTVGKSPYGKKWHLLRSDGYPACGYTSFNWKDGVEVKEVILEELRKLSLCANCRKKLR